MSWSKIVAVSTVVLFVFGFVVIDSAFAGEKMKWHGTGINTVWEKIEAGDGHVVGISKSKQIYINEITGEKTHSVSIGLMDINPKKKQVTGHGAGHAGDQVGINAKDAHQDAQPHQVDPEHEQRNQSQRAVELLQRNGVFEVRRHRVPSDFQLRTLNLPNRKKGSTRPSVSFSTSLNQFTAS